MSQNPPNLRPDIAPRAQIRDEARPGQPTIGMVSLGCPKALVDSERILTRLRAEGYAISPDYSGADAVIVNTCGFLDTAKAESLEAIGEALNENGRVIVTGCLGAEPEYITGHHPKVLAVTGPHQYEQVLDAVHGAATKGPWIAGAFSVDNGTIVICDGHWPDNDADPCDMRSIAALHNAYPAMSAELRALRKARDTAGVLRDLLGHPLVVRWRGNHERSSNPSTRAVLDLLDRVGTLRESESAVDPVNHLRSAIEQVEKNHPLPRCEHGSALMDHSGERLVPPCGCEAKEAQR